MKETELRAKKIRRKNGNSTALLRNKNASAAELRGMTLAFAEASGEHAAASGNGICLPIREATTSCKNCPQYRCKIRKLELRNQELESNVIETAALKFVEEARRNVKDMDWPSARKKLLLLFHPDKMHFLCPATATTFVKAFSTHNRW